MLRNLPSGHPSGAFTPYDWQAPGRTIPDRFAEIADQFPDRLATYDFTRRLTYGELESAISSHPVQATDSHTEAPPLDRTQVHVWAASLQTANESWSDLCVGLAPDERARADRFRTPQLRRRFVLARVFLRRLLATYAPVEAAALVIGYGTNGKPYLVDAPGLRFNVSHADDAALYAIAAGRDVGIDIEATGREVDVLGVARQAFSSHECEALAARAPDARREAFFRIWTRKEAYVKARGEGLSYPTRSFSVSHCGDDNALIEDERDGQAPDRWRVMGLDAAPGFTAALCAEGRDWTVLRFDAARLLS